MNLTKVIRHVINPQKVLTANISCLQPFHRLDGKKIIITGGGRGLGQAMAKKFISEGADVLITGRKEETLKSTALELGCKYIPFDVTDFENMDDFLFKANEMLCGANVLVNNAGISLHEGTIRNVSYEQYDAQFETNLKAVYFLTQKFLKLYEENHRTDGCILFLSSERGQHVDDVPYGLIKASINSLTQGLAKMLIRNNIRINAIAPGITATEMTGRTTDNLYSEKYATGRYYLPEEVAEVACFLISDAASCLSGQILVCNNGKSINYRK
ncbi:MAG: SDR family oxidoreductase [Muribaculaceae bacterium]|nr:SDR family oxidoreductase [Muribaculaceae bacterium]